MNGVTHAVSGSPSATIHPPADGAPVSRDDARRPLDPQQSGEHPITGSPVEAHGDLDVRLLVGRDLDDPYDSPLGIGAPPVRRPDPFPGEHERHRPVDAGLSHRRGQIGGHRDHLGAVAEPDVDLGEPDSGPIGAT